MRFLPLFIVFILCFTSCKSSRVSSKNKIVYTNSTTVSKADRIVANAKSFEGTKYKYGGTTTKGMDCSGLIYIAFKTENIFLPRVSREIAKKGNQIRLSDVKKGDLLFFRTKKKSGSINHVGLVVNTSRNNIEFIHSTTSKGVITSFLSESYWNNAFLEVRRIL